MCAQVECADVHGNTLLSEAAAGGALATVEHLLQSRDADPNTQGEFKRTPLWRAAFLAKAAVIGPLLAAGADPRIPNEAGELPQHVAATPEMAEQLRSWDTAHTDELVQARQKLVEAAQAHALEKQAAVLKARLQSTVARTPQLPYLLCSDVACARLLLAAVFHYICLHRS